MKRIISGLITVILSLGMLCTVSAIGLPGKPDISGFEYALADKSGNPADAMEAGGSLSVSMKLENNTASKQDYVVSLQILKNDKKLDIKSAKGEIEASKNADITLTYDFADDETDFSGYGAEVYVWSDMDSMQPISTYSVFGSSNNDIYAYKIDDDFVHTSGKTELTYAFAKNYSGIPTIRPLFFDLASRCASLPEIGDVTPDTQRLGFKVLSQSGSEKEHYLDIFKVTDETDPKNADLKSIKLPYGAYNSNYHGLGHLYPSFDKDVTEYNVFTYMNSYAGLTPDFETVNPDANVEMTVAPDTSLTNTTAVYTVTSPDGTVTKDYTINYTSNRGTTLEVTDIVNGYTGSGTSLYDWFRGSKDPELYNDSTRMAIQDGYFNNRTVKPTRPIMEIDISAGPDSIEYGVLNLSLFKNIHETAASASGTMRIYKIDDSIYDVDDINTIGQNDTSSYFADEMCAVEIRKKVANNGDMYYIYIDADYYNSLKASGRTKMYLGFAGETHDATKALGVVFGGGGTAYNNSRFHCIAE
ncbi:MAG: hypothetical protein IJB70_05650 [Clostridia bacterium]|nr:hypothetical protein [Clostridia bacterium]